MATFDSKVVVKILSEIAQSSQLDSEQVDSAIDALEQIKNTIDPADDETIDKVDEIQDYLQYLLNVEDSAMEEIKKEISHIIEDLQKYSQ